MVLFMTPGLAFFYGGLINHKSVLTIMMQCMTSLGLTFLVWIVVGFSLVFGESQGGWIGDPSSYAFLRNIDPCTPVGYPMQTPNNFPAIVFVCYQGMFAVIAPAIITGAFAERITFKAYLPFIVLWLLFVYCPFGHWAWNPDGWLHHWGVRDFAGGIVVHISAGFSALASIFVVGPRQYPTPEIRLMMQMPHNRAFVVLGTGMLWFGWLGFNGGSALESDGTAGFAIVNSCITAATAMLTWVSIETWHSGKPTVVGACVGAVGGLVMLTPCGGWIRPWAAIVLGLFCTPICFLCTVLKERLGWDDALDAWGVHGMGGLVGMILLGVLEDPGMGEFGRGYEYFGKQLAAALLTAVWSFAFSYVLLRALGTVITLRPPDEVIERGLDFSEHGEDAYHMDWVKRSQSGKLLIRAQSRRAWGGTHRDLAQLEAAADQGRPRQLPATLGNPAAQAAAAQPARGGGEEVRWGQVAPGPTHEEPARPEPTVIVVENYD